jgi:hypothetical protein
MRQRQKQGITREDPDEQIVRDQEVLRANRELAAYFKGRRTEREARTALKIIKAFIRDRERMDAKSRPALPGLGAKKMPKPTRKPAAESDEQLS